MLFQGRGTIYLSRIWVGKRKARRLLRRLEGKTATDPRKGDPHARFVAATTMTISASDFTIAPVGNTVPLAQHYAPKPQDVPIRDLTNATDSV